MNKQGISKGLKKFIREQIQTISRLEVLLLLHRHQPKALLVSELSNELGCDDIEVETELGALESLKLIDSSNNGPSRYRYQPHDAAVRSMVNRLAVSYDRHRIPILTMILRESPDPIRQFTEAFSIIRKNDP